jgi:hypothetical protein
MPTSKHRKTPVGKKKRKPAPPQQTKKTIKKLHSSRLNEIRDKVDAKNFIKLSRPMNAMLTSLKHIDIYKNQETALATRHYRRAGIELASYLHEALMLIDRIKGYYLGDPDFEPLRVYLLEPEYEDLRKAAKDMRNFMGFHFDHKHDITSKILAGLKASNFTMVEGDDGTLITNYFEMADYIDFAYFMGEKTLSRGLDDTANGVIRMFEVHSDKFVQALNNFLSVLWNRSLAEHVY